MPVSIYCLVIYFTLYGDFDCNSRNCLCKSCESSTGMYVVRMNFCWRKPTNYLCQTVRRCVLPFINATFPSKSMPHFRGTTPRTPHKCEIEIWQKANFELGPRRGDSFFNLNTQKFFHNLSLSFINNFQEGRKKCDKMWRRRRSFYWNIISVWCGTFQHLAYKCENNYMKWDTGISFATFHFVPFIVKY